jgi:hypothetical protein
MLYTNVLREQFRMQRPWTEACKLGSVAAKAALMELLLKSLCCRCRSCAGPQLQMEEVPAVAAA